ncbi:MAG TPA: beta-N-acetylhexosaminidase [Terriglobales bacterium]|nr:beta-N-acetylhexosaminidase [Terriglobales bacterium]
MRDLREHVGQLLIFGFEGTEPSARLRSAITTIRPGGIILFARNIVGPRQTRELLKEARALAATPVFLCVDMEGGTVDRLKAVIAPAPSAADVFATGRKKLFRQHGRLIGEECRALGFNVDFAPVLDLGLEPSRSVLASRTVSARPKETVTYAKEFLKGLSDAHILGCGKHFPGLGEANLDTHHELPTIKKKGRRLWSEDLYPYRKLRKELPFVMVAHAAYPDVTCDRTPASLSPKWISEILREKIGYGGLVISDDLEMGGVLAGGSIEHAAVETLRAGADLFLVCHNEAHVWATYRAVLAEAVRDKKFAGLVARAARRVIDFKKRHKELRRFPAVPSERALRKLREEIARFSASLAEASA